MPQAVIMEGGGGPEDLDRSIEDLKKQMEELRRELPKSDSPLVRALNTAGHAFTVRGIVDTLEKVPIVTNTATAVLGAIDAIAATSIGGAALTIGVPLALTLGTAYAIKAIAGDEIIEGGDTTPYYQELQKQYEGDVDPETRARLTPGPYLQSIGDGADALRDYGSALDSTQKSSNELRSANRSMGLTLDRTGLNMDEARGTSAEYGLQVQEATLYVDAATQGLNRLNHEFGLTEPAAVQGTDTLGRHSAAAKDSTQAVLGLADGVQRVRLEIDGLSGQCSQAAATVQAAAAGIVGNITGVISGCRSQYETLQTGTELTQGQVEALTATFTAQGSVLGLISAGVCTVSEAYIGAAVSALVFCAQSQAVVTQVRVEQNAWASLRLEIERTMLVRGSRVAAPSASGVSPGSSETGGTTTGSSSQIRSGETQKPFEQGPISTAAGSAGPPQDTGSVSGTGPTEQLPGGVSRQDYELGLRSRAISNRETRNSETPENEDTAAPSPKYSTDLYTIPEFLEYVGALGEGQANAKGGILKEPIVGFGLRSHSRYTLAESGPEAVLPLAQARANAVNITITGNHIASDYDVDRIGQQLVRRLRLAGVIV